MAANSTLALGKASLFAHFFVSLMVLFSILSCDRSTPLRPAPIEKKEVKEIFYALMEIAYREYGIKPIENLKNSQPIKVFVRSFASPIIFKKSLEKAFAKVGYSYSETLKVVADDGLTIIMDIDGGAGMTVLLAMPAKGLRRKDIGTIFSGDELKDFEAVLALVDKYLCCPLLDDF